MKQKEELQLPGHDRVSRQIVKQIRSKIRKERRSRMQKKGFISQQYKMSDLNSSEAALQSRGRLRRRSLSPIALQKPQNKRMN